MSTSDYRLILDSSSFSLMLHFSFFHCSLLFSSHSPKIHFDTIALSLIPLFNRFPARYYVTFSYQLLYYMIFFVCFLHRQGIRHAILLSLLFFIKTKPSPHSGSMSKKSQLLTLSTITINTNRPLLPPTHTFYPTFIKFPLYWYPIFPQFFSYIFPLCWTCHQNQTRKKFGRVTFLIWSNVLRLVVAFLFT